eukprot:TRINITY_DN27977_c0_g1_i1.p1 TRINITY_DN27977_c0_g1~~TRINITY_DN27977_c0_g1_i1.p1  ORF type:complete len:138 (+),score=28.98 TRINITY_DN27977_c0_g1_i1:109-522(+)
MTMAKRLALLLAAASMRSEAVFKHHSLGSDTGTEIVRSARRVSQMIEGPVPSDGKCVNELSVSTGNHCVYIQGQKLQDFMTWSNQDFRDDAGNTAQTWCICLHLYADWKKSHSGSAGDCSQCSDAAMTDAGLTKPCA